MSKKIVFEMHVPDAVAFMGRNRAVALAEFQRAVVVAIRVLARLHDPDKPHVLVIENDVRDVPPGVDFVVREVS